MTQLEVENGELELNNEDQEETANGDGSSESGEEDDGSGDDSGSEAISGWADSMAKILKSTKPKHKRNLILSRARKDYEVNKSTQLKKNVKGGDIEIAKDDRKKEDDDDDNMDVKGKGKDDDILSFKQQRKLELRQRKLELAWENLNRMSTTEPDREMEKDLLKIATRGVVQLFNAVAQQQKTIKTKLNASRKSEFKKEKVLSESKELFDKAMNKSKMMGKSSTSDEDEESEIKVKSESSSDEEIDEKSKSRKRKSSVSKDGSSKKPAGWKALQDDFMLDAKVKDWDKDSDSD